ncbi:MAG: nicotinate (nicotinamide) nucleotide adenylyltransferase [Planctomycetota bacterium]
MPSASSRDAIPVPADVRTLLIFGGSFDPPHLAHVTLSIAARDALGLDWLLVIPAGRSPFKSNAPIANDSHRVSMLERAFSDDARSSVSTIELGTETGERPPSYTVDTLRRLRDALPGVSMRLLIGADQALSFHRWREFEAIISLAEPAVMPRPGDAEDPTRFEQEMLAHWSPEEAARWRQRLLGVPTLDVSATAIREAFAGRGDRGVLDRSLDPRVLAYIREHGVYDRPCD